MSQYSREINIAIALNSKYMRYAYVMLTSLFIHHPDTTIHVYALHIDLTESDMSALSSLAQSHNSILHFMHINPSDFPENLPTTIAWSLEAYFRLQLIDILPEHVDRILYLDIDMIICNSLTELYQEDFEDNLFCVCKDMTADGDFSDIRHTLFSSFLQQGFVYFNSGMMLWNIKKLRGNYSFSYYMQLASDLNYNLLAPDQDLLNYAHWQQVKYVDELKYDLFTRLAHNHGVTYEDITQEVSIIHFAGYKPWSGEYVHYDLERIWWDYAKLTPYYNELMEDFLHSSITSTLIEEKMRKLIDDNQIISKELDKSVALCQKLYSMLQPSDTQ